MQLAGGSTANHDGDVEPRLAQRRGHIHHLFQTGGDETAQADEVYLLFDGFFHNLVGRHHHAHIDHLIVVAGHHHSHDVLTDVVHIAFHRGKQNLAGLRLPAVALRLYMGLQMGHGLLHRACRLHHLGKKHLAGAEQLPHKVHASHQRTLDNVHGPRIF